MLLRNLENLRRSDRNNISIAVIPFAVLIGIGKYRYIFGIRYDYIGILAVILIIFLSFISIIMIKGGRKKFELLKIISDLVAFLGGIILVYYLLDVITPNIKIKQIYLYISSILYLAVIVGIYINRKIKKH